MKLTIAALGRAEYNRLMAERKRRSQGIEPRKYTGLSLKRMTRREYDRRLYQLKLVKVI